MASYKTMLTYLLVVVLFCCLPILNANQQKIAPLVSNSPMATSRGAAPLSKTDPPPVVKVDPDHSRSAGRRKMPVQPDPTAAHPAGEFPASVPLTTTKTIYKPGFETHLKLEGAALRVPSGALTEHLILSIEALPERDVPVLHPGMVNVTAGGGGYRYLPHGTLFAEEAMIQMAYDPSRIPAGFTEYDVRTYFFDEDAHTWRALDRDSVDRERTVIVSRTDHFTDMINAVIQAPEAPSAEAFQPTSIKGLTVADPAAAVTRMDVPVANNMGSATTTFPFKIPAGRQGMQPEVALLYDSEGGHSWVGLGWDLSFPAISIDTRWGVPRFSDEMETETYTLNGQQLYPTAHRKELEQRNQGTLTKQFWPRVEGDFQRIIRHGTQPDNYWWEVTDKTGVKHFYGGLPDRDTNVIEDAVLRSYNNNIAYWALTKTEDLNGNKVCYCYEHQRDTVTKGGSLIGDQLYIKRITYTGHDAEKGKYKIRFYRENEGKVIRPDVDVNARLGFLQVTADRLKEVKVLFNNLPVRRYELKYTTGAFHRSLLRRVTEYDSAGNAFTTHSFDYFDDVREKSQYKPFDDPQKADYPSDGITAGFANPIPGMDGKVSALSGVESYSWNSGMAVTVGISDGNLGMKSFTAGGHFNRSVLEGSWGLLTMVDINGDGLDDKVFMENDGLYYRPNLSGPETDTLAFGDAFPISGAGGHFFREKSRTWGGGPEANLGYKNIAGFVGSNFENTESVTSVYFADVNGDELVDLVRGGVVYFNHIDSTGRPGFSLQSEYTPNPIGEGAAIDGYFGEFDPELEEMAIQKNPLHDVVRMWVAPRTGRIRIDGEVQLIADFSDERDEYFTADGVLVSIQLENAVIWKDSMGEDEHQWIVPSIANRVYDIRKGQRLFFRVQSRYDGAFDQVYWNPTITYEVEETESDRIDINDKPVHRFNAADDYVLSAPVSTSMPKSGEVVLENVLKKPVTTDRISLEIWKTDSCEVCNGAPLVFSLVDSITFQWDEVLDTVFAKTFQVIERENFWFRLTSPTNIDWNAIEWNPYLYYTRSDDPQYPDSILFNNGEPILEFWPVVDYSMYVDAFRPTLPLEIDTSDFDTIWPRQDLIDHFRPYAFDSLSVISSKILAEPFNGHHVLLYGGEPEQDTAYLTFSAKRRNHPPTSKVLQLVAKPLMVTPLWIWQLYKFEISAPGGTGILIENVEPDEEIWIEYHTRDRWLAQFLERSTTFYPADGGISYRIATDLPLRDTVDLPYRPVPDRYSTGFFAARTKQYRKNPPADDKDDTIIFGPMYRGWGQFAYNGNPYRDQQPIDLSLLKFDEKLAKTPPSDTTGAYSPASSSFILFIPVPNEDAWKGYDYDTYVKAETISSSRMNLDYPRPASPIPLGKDGVKVRAVDKITESDSWSVAGGGSFSVGKGVFPNGSYVHTEATTRIVSDFTDMNGDQYPDVVGKGKIQFTNARGELESYAKTIAEVSETHKAESFANGATLGGAYIRSKASGGKKQQDVKKVRFQAGDGASSAGIGGAFAIGEDEAAHTLRDINSDGLLDMIYTDGKVAFNLGYWFAEATPWEGLVIDDGESISYGGGLGINICNGSIQAGIGLSRSDFSTEATVEDVNGDGLLDRISKGNPIQVRLNKGNGFGEWVAWEGASSITEGAATSESTNVAVTGCILVPIPFPTLKICFNPGSNVGQEASREYSGIKDINGDGFPDFLQSDSEGDLRVSLSRIGRTNKLKSIQRPLGDSIAIDYKLVGNTYKMPFALWTLSKLEIHDGFPGDGADRQLTTFAYEDGYYDRHEREFYGFATVEHQQRDTENGDALYRTYTQYFNNKNYYKKGLPAGDALTDADGKKYFETNNNYDVRAVQVDDSSQDYRKDDAGAWFPAMVRTGWHFYEGQDDLAKSSSLEYDYDAYGNVILYKDLGEPTTGEDDLVSDLVYHQVDQPYIVGTPQSIRIRGGDGKNYRRRESEIDPNTGNVTKIIRYSGSSNPSVYDMTYDTYGNLVAIDRPGNHAGERLAFTYSYDPQVHTYVEKIQDSYGYAAAATYDYRFGELLTSIDQNGQEIQYELDDFGRLTRITGPYELANSADYTIRHEYHPGSGLSWARTWHYDPSNPDNPLETVIFMDGLGRELQTKKDAAIFDPVTRINREKMIVSGAVEFDAFGRAVQVWYPVEEEKGTEEDYNYEVDPVAPTKTHYDVLDRPVLVTLPDSAETKTEYGFGDDRTTGTQFLTRITDPNGNYEDHFTNVRGLEVALKEYLSESDIIWTRYAYNPIDELTKVTDDLGNEILSEYDMLGRRTKRIHPDAGETEYKYDPAGNLIGKITANLREKELAIQYLYDRERLKEIKYPLNPQNNVAYEYGNPGEEHLRAGRIRTQKDASGEQTFFYGRLGEVVKTIRTIRLDDNNARTFTTRWTYDTWGRVTSMVYPDMEILTYDYDIGGKLYGVKGSKRGYEYRYLKQLGYDKFEEPVFMAYGNGTETVYGYEDDRGRLNHLSSKTARGRLMMDNHYTYDNLTNILKIENQAPPPRLDQLGGPATYDFQYDGLYRLTRADGLWENKEETQRFKLEVEYNHLHDIVRKEQLHQRRIPTRPGWLTSNQTTYDLDYAYEYDQPHAASRIGSKEYEYDANGNMIGRVDNVFLGQRRTLHWDEEDRLIAIDDEERRHSYVYDADDVRVLKRKEVGQYVYIDGELVMENQNLDDYTVYVNPYLVITAAGYTKHFFIEGQRVTSKIGLGGPYGLGANWGDWGNWASWEAWDNWANDSDWDKIDLPYSSEDEITGEGNWNDWYNEREFFEYYYHPDHIGSSAYITDALGEVHQHLEYLPFGELFVAEYKNIDRSPYLFNARELDEETGLYYYGARYYDPQGSRWLSVDLQAENYPSWSPFSFAFNNPVSLNERGEVMGAGASARNAIGADLTIANSRKMAILIGMGGVSRYEASTFELSKPEGGGKKSKAKKENTSQGGEMENSGEVSGYINQPQEFNIKRQIRNAAHAIGNKNKSSDSAGTPAESSRPRSLTAPVTKEEVQYVETTSRPLGDKQLIRRQFESNRPRSLTTPVTKKEIQHVKKTSRPLPRGQKSVRKYQ